MSPSPPTKRIVLSYQILPTLLFPFSILHTISQHQKADLSCSSSAIAIPPLSISLPQNLFRLSTIIRSAAPIARRKIFLVVSIPDVFPIHALSSHGVWGVWVCIYCFNIVDIENELPIFKTKEQKGREERGEYNVNQQIEAMRQPRKTALNHTKFFPTPILSLAHTPSCPTSS